MNEESLKAASDHVSRRLRSLRPGRTETLNLLRKSTPTTPKNPLKRCQQENLPVVAEQKRRRSLSSTISPVVDVSMRTPPPTPISTSSGPTNGSRVIPSIIPAELASRLSEEILYHVMQVAAVNARTPEQFTLNVTTLLLQYMNEVSPSSEACSSSSSSYRLPQANSSTGGSSSSAHHHSGSSSGPTRTVASTRERKSNSTVSGRSATMRSLSPAHPSAVMSGMDDLLRPERFDRLMQLCPPDQFVQEQHSWNPDDRSLNIFVKDEDKFTFHRHPVAQSTDCIRGKIGYSRGFHVWQIEWPERQRGTHAVVGVATKTAPLHATGYTALIGTTNESYGWDITRRECHHDSKHTLTWRYPINNTRDVYHVPDKFYCILDMDEGYMAFATDEEYLGVAFRNLKGKTLYPIVAAVWGHCEISMRYLGSLEPEPLSLSELCRRRVRIELGPAPEEHIDELGLPHVIKRYLMYKC